MRNIPYWLNIGSILHQYGCASRVVTCQLNVRVMPPTMSYHLPMRKVSSPSASCLAFEQVEYMY